MNIDDTKDVTPHLDDAESEIDGTIGMRYTLPLSGNANFTSSPAQKLIVSLATKLAAGFLMLQMFEGQGDEMSKVAWAKISAARATLKMIAKGEIKLIDTASTELATVNAGLATLKGYPDNTADEDQGETANPRKFTMLKEF